MELGLRDPLAAPAPATTDRGSLSALGDPSRQSPGLSLTEHIQLGVLGARCPPARRGAARRGSRRMHQGQRPAAGRRLLARRRPPRLAPPSGPRVVLARAAAAQPTTARPTARTSTAVTSPLRRLTATVPAPGAGAAPAPRGDRWPAELRDHAAKRSAAAPPRARARRPRAASGSGCTPPGEQLARSGARDVAQAVLVAARSGSRWTRAPRRALPRPAEDLVHVGEPREGGEAVAVSATSGSPVRAPGRLAVRRKAPEPTFTSLTRPSRPAASFFARIDAAISGIDSRWP